MNHSACFADTFFFLALLNAADRTYHEKAIAANRVGRPIVTSAWVLLELADHLCEQQTDTFTAECWMQLPQIAGLRSFRPNKPRWMRPRLFTAHAVTKIGR